MLKIFNLLLLLMLNSCSLFSDGEVIDHEKQIKVTQNFFEENHYNPDLMPSCGVALFGGVDGDNCYYSDDDTSSDKFKLLHERFMSNLNKEDKIASERGDEDYAKAMCTLSVRKSCALKSIYSKYIYVTDGDIVDLITGGVKQYSPVFEEIYPENYTPETLEHFRTVILKGLPLLEEDKLKN